METHISFIQPVEVMTETESLSVFSSLVGKLKSGIRMGSRLVRTHIRLIILGALFGVGIISASRGTSFGITYSPMTPLRPPPPRQSSPVLEEGNRSPQESRTPVLDEGDGSLSGSRTHFLEEGNGSSNGSRSLSTRKHRYPHKSVYLYPYIYLNKRIYPYKSI